MAAFPFISPEARSALYKESNRTAKECHPYMSRVMSPFPRFFLSALPIRKGRKWMPLTPMTMTLIYSQPAIFSHLVLALVSVFSSSQKAARSIRERYAGPDQWGRVSLNIEVQNNTRINGRLSQRSNGYTLGKRLIFPLINALIAIIYMTKFTGLL